MNTLEQFKEYVQKINAKPTYTKPLAFGLGIRRSKAGKTLDVNFFGIPKEPVGTSNNPSHGGIPDFSEAKFALDSSIKSLQIDLD